MAEKKKFRISYNSPVVLTLAVMSLAALFLGKITNGWTTHHLFSVYRSSLLNPLTYLRLFTHIIGHANLQHFVSNFTIILLVGPMIEEKYGSGNLAIMTALTALITGILHSIFFPNVALCGASGICFMLIMLSSFSTAKKEKGIPLTIILVAIFYIGGEIVTALTVHDNISQFGHIIGGICGGGFGYLLKKPDKTDYRTYLSE